jgi:glycosyltransferase involved in cell wall biosynthesis
MKVKYMPNQPHCFAFGGFDIQMLATLKAVNNAAVLASKLDVWSRDSDFDILHCWGLGFMNYETYEWAKKAGKQLVSTILMYDIEGFEKKLKFKISSLIYKQRLLIQMLALPDAVVVVNESQAELCHKYYKVAEGKISIIPHVVDESFFQASKVTTDAGYILTTGNICRRKNQLSLAMACIKQNMQLVIIGKIMQGEEKYGQELAALVKANPQLITWIPELKENSTEILNYYANCSLFALPSFVEQQPISLLEAAIMQKPLLIADRNYAHQKFYSNAYLVDPASTNDIANGLMQINKNKPAYIPPAETLNLCNSKLIGSAYTELYNKVMG